MKCYKNLARILRVSILIILRLIYVINGGTPNKLTLARCERVSRAPVFHQKNLFYILNHIRYIAPLWEKN